MLVLLFIQDFSEKLQYPPIWILAHLHSISEEQTQLLK